MKRQSTAKRKLRAENLYILLSLGMRKALQLRPKISVTQGKKE